jgi:creatinine amidohydrolase
MSRRLERLRAPQVASALSPASVVVLPLGAIEQHGPHLPLHTDSVIARAVSEAAVERVGNDHDVWLLPALDYTKSNEHAWAPGSMWLSPRTLLAVALRELRLRHGLLTFLTHPSRPPDQGGSPAAGAPVDELGMGVHAGHDETSLMLHLAADLVDMSAARRRVPDHLAGNRHVRFGGSVAFGWTSDDFADDGTIGDPTGASAEHGAIIFENAVDAFGAALAEIAAFEFRS